MGLGSVRGGVREWKRLGQGVGEVGLGSVRGGVRECERWGQGV